MCQSGKKCFNRKQVRGDDLGCSWYERTTSIAFVQAFQEPVRVYANWKGPRTAAKMEIVNGLEGT